MFRATIPVTTETLFAVRSGMQRAVIITEHELDVGDVVRLDECEMLSGEYSGEHFAARVTHVATLQSGALLVSLDAWRDGRVRWVA